MLNNFSAASFTKVKRRSKSMVARGYGKECKMDIYRPRSSASDSAKAFTVATRGAYSPPQSSHRASASPAFTRAAKANPALNGHSTERRAMPQNAAAPPKTAAHIPHTPQDGGIPATSTTTGTPHATTVAPNATAIPARIDLIIRTLLLPAFAHN